MAEGSDVAGAIVARAPAARDAARARDAHHRHQRLHLAAAARRAARDLRARRERRAGGAAGVGGVLRYKHGLPADADLVFDVRFLPNPFYVEDLRPLTGRDEPVADYVLRHPATQEFLDLTGRFLAFALPWYEREARVI